MYSFNAIIEVKKSHQEKNTSPLLRDYIFSLIDKTNEEFFGNRSSFKCAQTALATAYLLHKFNIKPIYILGAICVPKIAEDHTRSNWHGFWGADHHYWIMTEFGEIVDLSVAYIHGHPKEQDTIFQMPPIWINTKNGMPNCFKYLPDQWFNIDFSNGKPNTSFEVDNDETTDLSPKEELSQYWKALDKNLELPKIKLRNRFSCRIESGITEESLKTFPSVYLNSIPAFLNLQLELPSWVRNRESELMASYT